MSDNEKTFNTKYGAINVSTSAGSTISSMNLGASSVADAATINLSTAIGNTYGISLKSDGSIDALRSTGLDTNSVEIDDDPSNTYGLASKVYLLKQIAAHESDSEAHQELFNDIITKLTDLYEEKGELKAYKISDDHGNVINANGRVILKGDEENPKYIMVSSKKLNDFDKVISDLIELIGEKQTKLTVKEGGDLTLDDNGNLDVADMRYDDSIVNGKIAAIENKEDYWNSSVKTFTDVGGQKILVSNGNADMTSLFGAVSSETDPNPSGILKNTLLDKAIVKVVNSMFDNGETEEF